jgi:hypothetical protein
MPVQNFSGLSSRTNEGYKFGGTFALGTTPTLLDNTEARRVKWFIENMVFRSAFEINVGTPATNQFLADFSNGEAVKWRLDLQTALRYDREPRLGANLDLRGHDILFRELSRLVQWGANGFQFHPQNYPANTDADLRVIHRQATWRGADHLTRTMGLCGRCRTRTARAGKCCKRTAAESCLGWTAAAVKTLVLFQSQGKTMLRQIRARTR